MTPLVIGLVLAAAICYVLAPLVWPSAFGVGAKPQPEKAEAAGDPLERLRDDLFAQLVELDFDHATGKTDDEEYQQDRAALKRRALAVLRTLDERVAVIDADDADADDPIERAVREARARRAAAPDDGGAGLLELDDEVERQVAALRQARGAPKRPATAP